MFLLKDPIKLYTGQLERHGPTYKAAGWGSMQAEHRRYDIIMEGLKPRRGMETVLDVGCGLGNLSERVKAHSLGTLQYEGWDITPGMVDAARERHPYAGVFNECDILRQESSQPRHWIVASGLFTYGDKTFFQRAVCIMWSLCTRGLMFNCLSTWGPKPEPDEYQIDPVQLLEFMRTLTTGKVVLRHDYLPHDVTVYAYK